MNWKSFVSLVYVIYNLLLIHCFIHLNRWESVLEKSARLWKKMPLGQSCITMMVPSSVLSSQSQRYIEYPWFSSSSSFFFHFHVILMNNVASSNALALLRLYYSDLSFLLKKKKNSDLFQYLWSHRLILNYWLSKIFILWFCRPWIY